MADITSVNNLNRVEISAAQLTAQGAQQQVKSQSTSNPEVVQAVTKVETLAKTEHQPAETSTKKEQMLNRLANTSLKFQVNPKTNEVTMMVVDRVTDKVVSTIPMEAINDIPAGQLFQYWI